jgi:hypothetical protein
MYIKAFKLSAIALAAAMCLSSSQVSAQAEQKPEQKTEQKPEQGGSTVVGLAATFRELHSVWSQLEGNDEATIQHRQLWINRIELEVAEAPDGPIRTSALSALGLLMLRNKQFEAAERVYNEVLADKTADPTLRMKASMDAFEAILAQSKFETASKFLDSFVEIYDAAAEGLDETAKQGFEIERANIDRKRAVLAIQSAMIQAEALRKNKRPAHEIARVELQGFQAGAKHMDDQVQFLKQAKLGKGTTERLNHLNWGIEASLFHSAEYSVEAIKRQSQTPEERRILAQNAQRSLEEMATEFPASKFSTQGGVVYLESLSHQSLKPMDFVAKTAWWLERTKPAEYGFLASLRERGVVFSSGDLESLEAANGLFQMVIDSQKKWFPKDYRNDVDYQWATVVMASNLIRLNEIDKATQMVNELKSLEIRGTYLTRQVEDVTRSINNYYAPIDKQLNNTVRSLGLSASNAQNPGDVGSSKTAVSDVTPAVSVAPIAATAASTPSRNSGFGIIAATLMAIGIVGVGLFWFLNRQSVPKSS